MAFSPRSWLFTPATKPECFATAKEAGADVVIVDLEDSVAPTDKARARQSALRYFELEAGDGMASALRINSIETTFGIDDLHCLLAAGVAPDFLILPKAESAGHISILDQLCTSVGLKTQLIGMVESARGLANVETLATSSMRLHGLMFGPADLAADLSASQYWEALTFARGRMVAACALAGIVAIDGPFFDLRDTAAFHREVELAAAMGFSAKAAIHPRQIAAINDTLTPTPADVEMARNVLIESEKGVGVLNGKMVDEAIARRARRTLDLVRPSPIEGSR